MSTRESILKYVLDNYNTVPEYLWAKDRDSAVLRHYDNRKWYGIIMSVSGDRIGLDNEELIDILNVKIEPETVVLLSQEKGFAPAYHMNKTHWITVLLNGSVPSDRVHNLLDMSYELTKRT